LRTSDEYLKENTRNQVYEEDPQSDGNMFAKTRDLSLWFGCENMVWPLSAALWWAYVSIFNA